MTRPPLPPEDAVFTMILWQLREEVARTRGAPVAARQRYNELRVAWRFVDASYEDVVKRAWTHVRAERWRWR